MSKPISILTVIIGALILGCMFAYRDIQKYGMDFQAHPMLPVVILTDFFGASLSVMFFYFVSRWLCRRKEKKLEKAGDDKFYEEVARELQDKPMSSGLWTKAFAETSGDDAKARALYIKYRVAQLAEASRQELEKNRIAKHQQEKPKRVKNIKIIFAAVFVLALVIAVICNTIAQQRRLAEKSDADAAYYLGLKYLTGINASNGVPKDYSEAFKWFSKAADLNHPDGQYYVGYCYYDGEGVEKNYTEAVKWFRKSADQNDLDAQYHLGLCYDHGYGVAKDEAQAVNWYLKAAEQGDSTAQCELGFCYAVGKGVAKDNAEAAKWYRKSADQGDGVGQLELGECYAHGQGVETNLVVAAKWFSLAATNDAFSAKRRLAEIESQMTPEQITQAQILSAYFVPRKQK
jgi:TPR repeat protein